MSAKVPDHVSLSIEEIRLQLHKYKLKTRCVHDWGDTYGGPCLLCGQRLVDVLTRTTPALKGLLY
jgi:hypothetical protein